MQVVGPTLRDQFTPQLILRQMSSGLQNRMKAGTASGEQRNTVLRRPRSEVPEADGPSIWALQELSEVWPPVK